MDMQNFKSIVWFPRYYVDAHIMSLKNTVLRKMRLKFRLLFIYRITAILAIPVQQSFFSFIKLILNR